MSRIAYVADYFPSVSETFVQNEIFHLDSLGWYIRVFSLKAQPDRIYHQSVTGLLNQTDYCPNGRIFSVKMLHAHLFLFSRSPSRYLHTLLFTFVNNFTSVGDFIRGVYCFLKAVYFAEKAFFYNIKHVHAHFAHNRAAVAMLIAELTGITYSFTGHSSDIVLGVPMFTVKVKKARFIVVVSNFIYQKLKGRFPNIKSSKLHTIRIGIDLQRFRPSSTHSLLTKPHIVTVARLIEFKGIHVLIDACRILRDRGYEFLCTVAGDGELREELEKQIKSYGLESRVQILGYVGEAEVLSLLQQATVFALPSITDSKGAHDGLPVVLMEAMAVGLPTVSTRLSAIPELIDDGVCGLLVEEKDVTALANALERLLLDEELRQRLGSAARAKVEREYEIGHNVSRLAKLFEQV
jgi:colanic acid/amylovoran biosynthesis glycosyltransferase